jgi:MOSC domain-containing protein YiiM
VLKGRIVSVNVGTPRQVRWDSRNITTAIFKELVKHRVRIRRSGLDGDKQANLEAHGGPNKAVYAYPSEHYENWKTELNLTSLPWGMFGENLTTEGLFEESVRLGDVFNMGSATVAVTEPRFPCYKLGIKFGTMEMVTRFQTSGRSGFYLSVQREGEVGVGDDIRLVQSDPSSPTISEVFTSEYKERGRTALDF